MVGTGVYAIPAAHRVNIGRAASCNVVMSTTLHGQSLVDNIVAVANVFSITDIAGCALGQKVSATPQVRLSPDGVTWGAWQNWSPGIYTAQAFDFQVLLASVDPLVIALLTGFSFAVDVPDRLDSFAATAVPAAGTSVVYVVPFNGGPGNSPLPNVQITIAGASPGDDVILSGQTKAGFAIQVVNGGVGVARTVNITAQGY